ncbi:MAG: hypothetical protein J5713_02215 [Clostridia bacterium]|nr:hypothetical protein [Clostridia bacterium]
MFEDNWYLFLLLVMLSFFADGEISTREAYVMLSILLGLTLTNNLEDEDTTDNGSSATTSNSFCNKNL